MKYYTCLAIAAFFALSVSASSYAGATTGGSDGTTTPHGPGTGVVPSPTGGTPHYGPNHTHHTPTHHKTPHHTVKQRYNHTR